MLDTLAAWYVWLIAQWFGLGRGHQAEKTELAENERKHRPNVCLGDEEVTPGIQYRVS